MSKKYTLTVDASFAFDVDADSLEEAKAKARELLNVGNVVTDYGVFASRFEAPWVSIAGRDLGFESLEVVDVRRPA